MKNKVVLSETGSLIDETTNSHVDERPRRLRPRKGSIVALIEADLSEGEEPIKVFRQKKKPKRSSKPRRKPSALIADESVVILESTNESQDGVSVDSFEDLSASNVRADASEVIADDTIVGANKSADESEVVVDDTSEEFSINADVSNHHLQQSHALEAQPEAFASLASSRGQRQRRRKRFISEESNFSEGLHLSSENSDFEPSKEQRKKKRTKTVKKSAKSKGKKSVSESATSDRESDFMATMLKNSKNCSVHFSKGDLMWYIAVKPPGKNRRKAQPFDFDENCSFAKGEQLIVEIRVALSNSYFPKMSKKFVTSCVKLLSGQKGGAVTGHEFLTKFSEDQNENDQIFEAVSKKMKRDTKLLSEVLAHMKFARRVKDFTKDNELRLLYLTNQKELPQEAEEIEVIEVEGDDASCIEVVSPPLTCEREEPLTAHHTEVPVEESQDCQIDVSNEEILRSFSAEPTRNFLLDLIKTGFSDKDVMSKRHNMVLYGKSDFRFGSEIMKLGNILFLKYDHDIDLALMEKAMDIFDQSCLADRNDFELRNKYSKYVLIPEAILLHLRTKHHMSFDEAERYFVNTTSCIRGKSSSIVCKDDWNSNSTSIQAMNPSEYFNDSEDVINEEEEDMIPDDID